MVHAAVNNVIICLQTINCRDCGLIRGSVTMYLVYYLNRRIKFPNYFKKYLLNTKEKSDTLGDAMKMLLLENTKIFQLQMTLTKI